MSVRQTLWGQLQHRIMELRSSVSFLDHAPIQTCPHCTRSWMYSCCLPLFEGIPRVVMEAAAMEFPVVTDVKAIVKLLSTVATDYSFR